MSNATLPYERGDIIETTADDLRKLEVAWSRMAERYERGDSVFGMSGLERVLDVEPSALADMDDDLAPARYLSELRALALEHLGGDAEVHDTLLLNRQTAALWLAANILVPRGARVIGVSPTHSHPAVVRAVRDAGGEFEDVEGLAGLHAALERDADVEVVMLTRLAVSYDILETDELHAITALARQAGARIVVDDAGGARVGPAVFDQPRSLELDVDVVSTGLDKYGTTGPRLGLMGGAREVVADIRARAYEMGMEARQMLYPAVVRSLAGYRPERVRELVETTRTVCAALAQRLGSEMVVNTPVIGKLRGESILELALKRAGLDSSPLVPYEATAALAMLLLRDAGIFTVHFAGIPPGTSALLIKFLPPERLAELGGADAFARAVDDGISSLAALLHDPDQIRSLLLEKTT